MPAQDEAERTLTASLMLDRSSPVPLYFQVARQLAEAIESGSVAPGARLPNEMALSLNLSLSRPTVRKAMEFLVDKGLIVRQRGVGTRVVSSKVTRSLELTSLYDDLTASGQQPGTSVLALDYEGAPDEVAEALDLAPGAPVLAVQRLRTAMDQPIAHMTNYLDPTRFSATVEQLEAHGLYDLLRRAGIQLHSATQMIGARTATAAEARLLADRRGAALLTMRRTAYDVDGRPVEYGTHVYSASRYNFRLTLRQA